jgi:hypothetical protein
LPHEGSRVAKQNRSWVSIHGASEHVDVIGLPYGEEKVNEMPITLYHFTPKSNYQGMLASQCINPGKVAMPDGKTAAEIHAISLTKSTSCLNLGIPTGRIIPPEIFSRLDACGAPFNNHCLVDGKRYQIDHSAIRIELKLDLSDELISAKEFYSENPKMLAALALVAAEPFGVEHLSSEAVDERVLKMTDKRVKALTGDWWYFRGSIPWSKVSRVAEKQSAGFYKNI